MGYEGHKAKINLGEFGLLTDVSPDKAPPGTLIQSQNICFFNGAVEKAPGSIQWNATAVAAGIVAAHYWIPNAQTLQNPRYVVATSNGNLYKGRERVFGTPINTTIASVLTPNCVFADGGAEVATNPKKLFFFTGGATNPYVLNGDGTAFTVLSKPSVDWTASRSYPKFGCIHRGSLWAFAGQIAYKSNPNDHEDFQNVTTTQTFPVYPGEGGELRSAFVYKGRLFGFKDGGFVYALIDTDTSTTNWYWQRVASNFGIAAPNAVAEVIDDMLVGNSYGTITSFAATQNLGNVEAADIIQNAKFESYWRSFVSKSGILFEHMKYYAEKKMLFMTCRSTYGTTNDSMLMLDFGRKDLVRASVWTKGSPQCLAKYKDVFQVERMMYGDASGFLNLMDWADRTEGTASYTGGFQIQHTDLSFLDPALSSMEKHFDFLAVHYIPSLSANLSCDYYIDGAYVDTITFPLSQYTKPQLGIIQLDTNRPGQPTTETSIRPLAGTGRTFSAYFYQSGSNQSFQVPAITVYFRPGGDGTQTKTS